MPVSCAVVIGRAYHDLPPEQLQLKPLRILGACSSMASAMEFFMAAENSVVIRLSTTQR